VNILQKIQNLPESQRKIILWSLVIIIGLGLSTWVFKNLQKRTEEFQGESLKEELNIPLLEEELQNLPELNF